MPWTRLLMVLVAGATRMASGMRDFGVPGFGVLAAHRAAGPVLDGGGVEEVERGRGGGDLDRPAAVLGQHDARADRGRRASATGDRREEATGVDHPYQDLARRDSGVWPGLIVGSLGELGVDGGDARLDRQADRRAGPR
jgi:hypothetical protein